MAISRVGTPTSDTGATAGVSVTPHASTAAGDLLVCRMTNGNTSTTWTAPTGYTLERSVDDGTNLQTKIYVRTATGDANDVFAVTQSAGTRYLCALATFRGVDTSNPFIDENGQAEAGTSATHAAPSLTNTDAAAWALLMGAAKGKATPFNWTSFAGGVTETADTDGTVGSTQNITGCVADSGAGVATGTVSLTGTANGSTAIATMWAGLLRPAVTTTEVVKTSATSWAVRAEVPKTSATSWNTRAAVAKTVATSFNVRAEVAKTSQTAWAVRTSAVKTSATSWAVRSETTKTSPTSWGTRAEVTKTVSTSYAVRTSVAKTSQTGWAVRTSVAQTGYVTGWAVRGAVVGTTTTTWATRAQIAAQRSTAWAVRAQIVKTVDTSWNVGGTAAAVVKTVATAWAVRAEVAKTAATSWAVRVSAVKTSATSWNVRAEVAKQLSTSWGTRSTAVGTYPTSWAVRTSTAKTVATSWGTRAETVRTSSTSWNVRATITRTVFTSWRFLEAVKLEDGVALRERDVLSGLLPRAVAVSLAERAVDATLEPSR